MNLKPIALVMLGLPLVACGRGDHFGKPPSFTEQRTLENPEHVAM